MDTMKMIEISQRFIVRKTDEGYEIVHKEEDVAALIEKEGTASYFVTGVYNSGLDWAEINLIAFEELKEFCQLILKQEGK